MSKYNSECYFLTILESHVFWETALMETMYNRAKYSVYSICYLYKIVDKEGGTLLMLRHIQSYV